ncbi:F-box/LRR-repeat protein fbxl-1-like [Haliotis cracherodii]|uniref:F-box/LRR-repeat protein fbxl-1-like n=1 Tax=Haliotis cracherodii TaxID=6455 RepID=UPI0039E7AE18
MKRGAMDREEAVLVVGSDISLADLQAEMEVGGGGGEEEQDASSTPGEEEGSGAQKEDMSSFELFETRNVFCFFDENLLDSNPHVLPDNGQGNKQDLVVENLSPDHSDCVSTAGDVCGTSADCAEGADHQSSSHTLHTSNQDIKVCDVKSQESFQDNKSNNTSSPSVSGLNQRGESERNNTGINCDMNPPRLEKNDELPLYGRCKDSPSFPNGVLQGERWAQPSDNLKHNRHLDLTSPSQHSNGGALWETPGELPVQELSVIELTMKGASATHPAASSTAPSAAPFACPPQKAVIHTTVIDVHPGHIVHKHDKKVLESDLSEHYSVIQSLPEEILLNIFSYFSPKELCQYVAPVCRRWRVLAYEPTLWVCLKIDPLWEVSIDDLSTLLERVSGVKDLSLHARNGITYFEVFTYLKHCNHLTELDLGLCDSINIHVIECIVKFCPLLRNINLEGCSNIDFECVKQLASLRHLSHLNLSHCRLENDSILLLAYSIDSIMSFNVDGVAWITDDAIMPLCEVHKSSLKHLELDGEELTDRSISAVAKCQSLVTLNVSFCDLLSDASLEYLKDLKKLRKLRLRKGLEFSEEAVEKFFKHGHLHNVTDLDMSECAGMKDASLLSLTECCGSSLIVLALQWCWYITDIGLASIVECCSNLERLDLTGLHRLSGECLDRVPDDMVHLHFLDLRNCNNMNDKLICEMIRSKPDLQVINYYGEMFVYGEGSP